MHKPTRGTLWRGGVCWWCNTSYFLKGAFVSIMADRAEEPPPPCGIKGLTSQHAAGRPALSIKCD